MSISSLVRATQNKLYVEGVPLAHIATEFGTLSYVYSKAALVQAYVDFTTAFAKRHTLVCYAAKANSPGNSRPIRHAGRRF